MPVWTVLKIGIAALDSQMWIVGTYDSHELAKQVVANQNRATYLSIIVPHALNLTINARLQ